MEGGISKKRWNLGLRLTILTTLLCAAGSWGLDFNLKQALITTAAFLYREIKQFLKDHPIESISDYDTSPTKFIKTDVIVNTKISDQPIPDQPVVEVKPFEGK